MHFAWYIWKKKYIFLKCETFEIIVALISEFKTEYVFYYIIVASKLEFDFVL